MSWSILILVIIASFPGLQTQNAQLISDDLDSGSGSISEPNSMNETGSTDGFFHESGSADGTINESNSTNGSMYDSGSTNESMHESGSTNGSMYDSGSTNGFMYDSGSTNESMHDSDSTNGSMYDSGSTNGSVDESGSTNGSMYDSGSTNGSISGSTNGSMYESSSMNGSIYELNSTNGSAFGSDSRSGSGVESGSETVLDQVTCDFYSLNFEVFNTTAELYRSLSAQCSNSMNVQIELITVTQNVLLEYSDDVLLIEHLSMGDSLLYITVCESTIICEQARIYNITVSVGHSTSRLFPYGTSAGDDSFTGVLDGARPIYVPQEDSIPFFDQYYSRLWISSNGLVSFGWPYLSWWPIPFPFGYSTIPVIAPYWTDFDYRVRGSPSSRIFYQVYTTATNSTSSSSRLKDAIFESLRNRISSSDTMAVGRSLNFEAEWVAVITWNDAVPYYWRYNTLQKATFQLVLATDHLQTYAFYLYKNSTLNLPRWQRVVIGYDRKNFVDYRTIDLSAQQTSRVHTVLGNTGRTGEWLFDFSTPLNDSAELRCIAWSKRQTNEIMPSVLPRCPCTLWQAFRDWRYWFGFYWGLSSRPNCATVLFSGSASTTECCYDWSTGALLVGSNDGGTYQLYNPLFFFRENRVEDLLPYQDCCVSSSRCQLYFQRRQYDDCSEYEPPRFQFMFGDPHFTTIDNTNFTFNGIGEYVFVKTTPSLNFHIQGRLRKFETLVDGTVLSAIVVKYKDVPSVQVHGGTGGTSEVYVGGVQLEVEVGESPVIISPSGIVSEDVSGGINMGAMSSMMAATSSMMYIRRDNDSSVIISTGEGGSVTLGMQEEFLRISLEVPKAFMNQTSGLFGVFNDNPGDDFQTPLGEVLSINASMDKQVYYSFGLLWHLNESDSFFNYSIGNTSYSAINEGYLNHIPTFTEDISNTSEEVLKACNNDSKCLYDYSVTGDMELGVSTLNTATKNEETVKQISNTPPTITGNFTFFANYEESVTYTYTVEDPDGNVIESFVLKDPVPEGFSNATVGSTIEVTWSYPGLFLPEQSLQLFSSDAEGGTTVRTILVILCACINNGTCLRSTGQLSQLNFNDNSQYKWECACPEFFGGDSCEIDMRGCGEFSTCPSTSACTNDSTIPSGYRCDQCILGFEIIEAAGKCIDVDECSNTSVCGLHQLCTNNEGSYSCDCTAGYRMTPDNICEEIDECSEGTATCTQTCTNTAGSYNCGCQQGFTLAADNISCNLEGSCNTLNICDGIYCNQGTTASTYECICPAGQQCTGTCTGSSSLLHAGSQRCTACPMGTYGPRCNLTCSCEDNGVCNASVGCQCYEGWAGANCNIELNDYSPVFVTSTPSMITIRWDLNHSSPTVVTITATDSDIGPNASSVTYSLQPSAYQLRPGASDGIITFQIEPNTGRLSLNPLIMELNSLSQTLSEFVLTVEASDGGNPVRTVHHTLTVMPIPVPEFEQGSVTVEIDEELPQGTHVTGLNCTEIGRPSHSLKMALSGIGSTNFIVIETASRFSLVIARRIDYETLAVKNRVFDISATCSNSYGVEDTLKVRVAVGNIDDNKFAFEQARYTAVVAENVTSGAHVLTVTAVDKDFPGAVITYSTDSSIFRFTPNTNMIVLVGSLDRETSDKYSLNLTAQYTNSSGSLVRAFALVNIEVTDVNDHAPEFSAEVYFVNNITTNALIGDYVLKVSAVDYDAGSNSEIIYDFSEPNPTFSINSTTGEIFVFSTLFPQNYEFLVYAIDNGNSLLSTTALVNIEVQPYPIAIYLSFPESRVEESLPARSEVGRAIVIVIDASGISINDTSVLDITFSIVNGTYADRFVIDHERGEIFTLGSLDYDSVASQYSLILQATVFNDDSEITSDEVTATIYVTNIDDNPPRFTPQFYAIVIEQFTAQGSSVLKVKALDPDQLSNIEYSINSTSTPFLVNSTTGVITAQQELGEIQDYRFSVTARDGGAVESTAMVFISVTRSISVSPTFETNIFRYTLPENVPPGTYVGTVTALVRGNLSINLFSHLGYRISNPGGSIDFNVTNLSLRNISANLFHLDPASGNISTQGSLDYDIENRMDFFFYVEVSNIFNGVAYDYATVEIDLQDLNDNRPRFTRSFYTRVIDTSQPVGSVILTVTASDRDSGINGKVMYSIDGSQGNMAPGFSLNASSGAIAVTNSTLFPGDYYLSIIASDGGSPELTEVARVFVAILPSLPATIEFTESLYTYEIVEDALPNTLVGMVRVVEVNASLVLSNATYSLPNITECFGIDARSGEIRLTCTYLDREMVPTYELVVEGRVSDTVAVLGNVKISILDVNDNAPEFSRDVYTSLIDDRFGNDTAVLRVTADDQDFGRNGSVSYHIISQENPFFRIDNYTGEIFFIDNDIEVGDYRLSVYATDMGMPVQLSSSALVLVSVTRAYPQTLEFQTTTFDISENEPSLSVVGQVILVTNGGSIVNPSDFPDDLRFSIVGGDSTNNFHIDPDSGVLTTLTTFDREFAPDHVIEVLANFTQYPARHIQRSIMINILDMDERPSLDNSFYSGIIDDTASTGLVIVNISATDADAGANALVDFSLSGNLPSLFGVRTLQAQLPQTFGEIFVANESALTPGTYEFDVIATDQGSPPLTSPLAHVVIIVEHSIPEEIYFSSMEYVFHIPENMGSVITPPVVVGNVSLLPITPALDGIVYEAAGEIGLRYFSIDQSTGIVLKRPLLIIDREMESIFNLNITAYLLGHLPPLKAETMVTIHIDDLNDNAPMFSAITGSYSTVVLATDILSSSSIILNISASDSDIGRNSEIVYSIDSVTFDNIILFQPFPFMVDPQTGEVFTPFLNLSIGTYNVRFRATDGGDPPLHDVANVYVIVQQSAPSAIEFTQQNGYMFSFQENTGAGQNIGTITLRNIPEYLERSIRFSITDNVPFVISQTSGMITNLRQMDYELNKVFTFNVTVTLNDVSRAPPLFLRASTAVTVNIEDVNDNSPYFIDFPMEITQYEERPTPEVVHTILANDSDSGSNAELSFSILSSDVDDIVTINRETGEIVASAGLDRENPRQGSNHTLIIQVRDLGTPANCVEDAVVFRLLDINDNTPYLVSGFTYLVDEQRPLNMIAFYFEASDPDNGLNSTIVYNFSSPLDMYPFSLNPSNGEVSFHGFVIDYEITPLINLSLTLSDLGTPPREITYSNITVVVRDMPDNAPQFSEVNYQADISPTLSQGDLIAIVHATDADVPSSSDSLVYAITNITETGNSAVLPFLHINQTGHIFSSKDQEFWPEAQFEVTVLVYDQSKFNLSNITTVTIEVIPDILEFNSSEYSVSVFENLTLDSVVASLSIQNLSFSSDIIYNTQLIRPSGIATRFSTNGNGERSVNVTLIRVLDREVYDRWQLEVTATRTVRTRGVERALVILTINVVDVNDNRPIFSDDSDTLLTVIEGATSDTDVTRSNASDADYGDNGRLTFTFVDESFDFPFHIVSTTGEIRTRGRIDYEVASSYNMTVLVRDHGNPVMENRITYTVHIININDNNPKFAKPAYFGEVYARAPVNSLVKHTELIVTDLDDVTGEEPFSFNIRQQGSGSQDEYLFHVTAHMPHRIQVVRIPESADEVSQLLTFIIEVRDSGGLTAAVPLYLSFFTTSNLIFFQLDGANLNSLLSCTSDLTSICRFMETLGSIAQDELRTQRTITFYNDTSQNSPDRLNSVIIGLYGWYGTLDARMHRGELEVATPVSPVQYLTNNKMVFSRVSLSERLYVFAFSVSLYMEPTTTTPTSVTEAPAEFPVYPVLGAIVGVVLVVFVLVLLLVSVCVFGKRKNQPKQKSVPYDRNLSHIHQRHSRTPSFKDFHLYPTGQSNLFYDTNHEDDDTIVTNHTIPWFDPKYLASDGEEYGDDSEQLMGHSRTERHDLPLNLRATVDGDAKSIRFSLNDSVSERKGAFNYQATTDPRAPYPSHKDRPHPTLIPAQSSQRVPPRQNY